MQNLIKRGYRIHGQLCLGMSICLKNIPFFSIAADYFGTIFIILHKLFGVSEGVADEVVVKSYMTNRLKCSQPRDVRARFYCYSRNICNDG